MTLKNECTYCGEEEGVITISDPNGGLEDQLVCKVCKEVIKNQQLLTLGAMIKNKEIVNKANKELMRISEESGKPIFCGAIIKSENGYGSSFVVYKGDK